MRYSTARSGLLKLALRARSTRSRSKPISTIPLIAACRAGPETEVTSAGSFTGNGTNKPTKGANPKAWTSGPRNRLSGRRNSGYLSGRNDGSRLGGLSGSGGWWCFNGRCRRRGCSRRSGSADRLDFGLRELVPQDQPPGVSAVPWRPSRRGNPSP
jgi:hypothetical protein